MRPLLVLGMALSGLVLTSTAQAQYAEGGARTLALGRAGVALGADAWGHLNPAAWASLDERRAALQASQAFGLSEFRLGALSAASPTSVGTVALAARSYGFSERRETRVKLGYGRQLDLSTTRRLDVGVAVGVETASVEGYGSETAILLDLGVQGRVVTGLRAGLSARNLWRSPEMTRQTCAIRLRRCRA